MTKSKGQRGKCKDRVQDHESLAFEGRQFIVHIRTARKRALLAKAIAMKSNNVSLDIVVTPHSEGRAYRLSGNRQELAQLSWLLVGWSLNKLCPLAKIEGGSVDLIEKMECSPKASQD